MENASKALMMAGSVLMGVLVIGLIFTLVNALTEKANAENSAILQEQIAEFNKDYESYEKQLLRGTELITLINKANENNIRYETIGEEEYYIDIQFTLQSEIEEVNVVYLQNALTGAWEKENITITPMKSEVDEIGGFEEDKVYSLKKDKDKINNFFKIGAKTENMDKVKSSFEEDNITQTITKTNYAFTAFKRKYFRCTKIGYSKQTGRINLLVFEELVMKEDIENSLYY